MESATFAMGCFWKPQLLFEKINGVQSTTVGYTGGETANPSYEDVCYKNTGHAEAIEIVFDPTVVSYEDLLAVFWANHNPTTLNAQGPDHGEQYRSAIFTHSPEQKAAAEDAKDALEKAGKWKKPIVTVIADAETFYPAEDYHQDYLAKRGMDSCGI
ncbi:peptide-methionine (S)-S-oxide reductase [Candidatus Peregrinibacteria bacterium CG10_big_fil_rev_8_21_14_0_10_49_24]|nr:MAG: peptide-methionine (S)-S-oxide reductase [Candidatus Peregrinibacteria bacterium CG11_big_fil_rev_8_21_14_0_20_49_14]PIR51423.1 MAG: peptide-methionine (S)-S-oxide reductase [Candidatus Peregrinibacteria bacterium CG10_big_fil_rev_8_21_14_0_10_49_24]PJA67359.1 MAG: peptide-methionine (S)-S-oxide reductase [Candidatus Peregrinibacteria bacterium CG_4_9_14_3_um_filter_49_12]